VYGQLFLMPVEVTVKSLFTFQPEGLPDNTNGPQADGNEQQPHAGDWFVLQSSCVAAYMAFAFAMVGLTSQGVGIRCCQRLLSLRWSL
jgi:hypothetical protein